MRTRIISAFPGTGKSEYHRQHPETTLDSDSSNFSWMEDSYTTDGLGNHPRFRNPDFPANYIAHIKENIGKYEFIFVPSHDVVRKALQDNCLFFYLVYPPSKMKDEYIRRYKERGSPEAFIQLLDANFEKWVKDCEFCEEGCKQVRMGFPYLDDEIQHIIASEGGEQ